MRGCPPVNADEIRWVKFSGLGWAGNGSGFFYSRFPEPKPGAEHQAANHDHAVWFHRLGTDQSADFLVYATPDRPRLNHVAETTEDGRWLLADDIVSRLYAASDPVDNADDTCCCDCPRAILQRG